MDHSGYEPPITRGMSAVPGHRDRGTKEQTTLTSAAQKSHSMLPPAPAAGVLCDTPVGAGVFAGQFEPDHARFRPFLRQELEAALSQDTD